MVPQVKLINYATAIDDLMEELGFDAELTPRFWEFADVTFLVVKISRSTAAQLTRMHQTSFAIQSHMITDVSDATWDNPYDPFASPGEQDNLYGMFERSMRSAVDRYKALLCEGATLKDASDVLPAGLHCNIVVKYNLWDLSELIRNSNSIRLQGPHQSIINQMKALVMEAWPWSADILK